MGRARVDRAGGLRRRYPLKQFVWYAIQTGIVGIVLYGYHQSGGRDYGIALLLGIGWALCATVLFHLCAEGLRRLAVLVLPSRAKNRHPSAVNLERPLVPLEFLGPVDRGEGERGRNRRTRLGHS